MKKYNIVACGGTFDHFHKGHKEFLKSVSAYGENILIGITSDAYIQQKKKSLSLQSYAIRKEAVEKFVKTQKIQNVQFVELFDIAGPPGIFDRYEVLIVTKDSEKNVPAIQEIRKKNNLKPLEIIVVPLVSADDGGIISSRRIRNGEIDRNGKSFIKKEWKSKNLSLPESLRDEFKKPFGEVYPSVKELLTDNTINDKKLISVGDISTKSLHEASLYPIISVIDFIVERKKRFSSLQELGFLGHEVVYTIQNNPGTISSEAFSILERIRDTSDKKIVVFVEGEEDLLVLPLILVLPLDYIVIYGQPREGVVKVVITEALKQKAYSLASKMSF